MLNCPQESLFTDSQALALETITIFSCGLSMIGSLLIIISYYHWPDIRSTLRQLLLYLSITDFIIAVGNMVGIFLEHKERTDSLLCKSQSFLTTGASLSSFLWTMSIATYLYLMITNKHHIAVKLITAFHIIAWGVPLGIVSLSMGFDVLGYDEKTTVGWCWIVRSEYIYWPPWPQESKAFFWELFAGKGVELLCYIFITIVYILSRRALAIDRYLVYNRNIRETLHETDRKLVLIPIIFVFLRIWGTIRFLAGAYCKQFITNYGLAVLQSLGDSSQGLANCLLFCIFTKLIREKIWIAVGNVFRRSNSERDDSIREINFRA